ncbi:MAG: cation transporter [Actinobacteria bacterium]|nr:cation transporter [Actinomycetota bacterium]MCA1720018.1 cation transporter [Actinomycetota bacterium]
MTGMRTTDTDTDLGPTPAPVPAAACSDGCGAPAAAAPVRDAGWRRAARTAVLLSWASLLWMTGEGAAGLYAGIRAGSVALVGWALSSVVEGLASVIVIWRLTGSRTVSETSERTAQKAVAVSFWLLAPYVAVESVRDLLAGREATGSRLGIALTAASLVVMPLLGRAKHRLGARLGSAATAGEGTQNMLCAYLAGAVLLGLAANSLYGAWWLDPLVALAVAAVAVKEGLEAWEGDECC